MGFPGFRGKSGGVNENARASDAAREEFASSPTSHSADAGAKSQKDPLEFFTAPMASSQRHGGRRMMLIAGSAGAALGLVAVSLFITIMEGRSTAAVRPTREAAAERASSASGIPWQRPVISAKTDLEVRALQASADPAATAVISADPGRAEGDAVVRLASLSPETEILHAPAYPQVIEGILYYGQDENAAGAGKGNETVVHKRPPLEPVDHAFVLRAGETLASHLVRLGVSDEVARALQAAVEKTLPKATIPAGRTINVTLDRQQDFYGSEVTYPVYLSARLDANRKLVVESDADGRFIATIKRARTIAKKKKQPSTASSPYVRVRGTITTTLYAAARDKGVPKYIINAMMRAFGYSIDLQRQVSKGDTFEVLFGAPRSGTSRRRKVLYYAALTLRGKKHVIYRFTTPGGRTAYFDEKGRSVVRTLMRTPIAGAHITSRFGYRRHPILGYTKLHTGVDFGAPRGTPIRAAGDGVVIHAGWRGGYGRTVMIRHPNGYVTLYAHQSRIARGIRKGMRVRQGQVIGYVGASGRATGPHLHYEVRINNKPVNPLRVRVATRVRLKGKALKAFKSYRRQVLAILEKTPITTRVAQNTR